MDMRTENWNGHRIRFVYHNNEWKAVLKDICDALDIQTWSVTQRLDSDMCDIVRIEADPSVTVSPFARKAQEMTVVNELGIYEALFASRKLEARKFRRWACGIMKKFREHVGLEAYEAFRMTDGDIQQQISDFLDTVFYDEETGKLMRSVTVQGGDVEQVELDI